MNGTNEVGKLDFMRRLGYREGLGDGAVLGAVITIALCAVVVLWATGLQRFGACLRGLL